MRFGCWLVIGAEALCRHEGENPGPEVEQRHLVSVTSDKAVLTFSFEDFMETGG